MKILYISDEPKKDEINYQFLKTADYFYNNFDSEFSFIFLSQKTCKNNNIIDEIKNIGCEQLIFDVDCGCKSKYDEAVKYIDEKIKIFKPNVIQIGLMLKIPDIIISNNKSYCMYFRRGIEFALNSKINIDIVKKLTGVILTYDVLDYYDSDNYNGMKFDNGIIIPNTIETLYFKNTYYNNIELEKHMKSYYDLYL
jgi:hypothetical protein